MKIFDDKLTNKSLLILETIMDAVSTKEETGDIIIALTQAKLSSYYTKDGSIERFGYRMKKSQDLSFLFGVLNGMANRIEELEKQIAEK